MIQDQAGFIRNSISSVRNAALLGVVLTVDPAGSLAGAQTYADYERWAKDGGMRPVGRPNFYSRLGDMPGVEIKEGRGRAKILSGLKIMFPTSTPSSIVQGWKDKQSDGI